MSTGWAITPTLFDAKVAGTSQFTISADLTDTNNPSHSLNAFSSMSSFSMSSSRTLTFTSSGNIYFTGNTSVDNAIVLPLAAGPPALVSGHTFTLHNNNTASGSLVLHITSSSGPIITAQSGIIPPDCTGTVTYNGGGDSVNSWKLSLAYNYQTGSGANVTLSNLTTTAIDTDLLPSPTMTQSIGANTLSWLNGWFDWLALRRGGNRAAEYLVAPTWSSDANGRFCNIANTSANLDTFSHIVISPTTGTGTTGTVPAGFMWVYSITPGTGFRVNSTNLAEDNNLSYMIMRTF